jgi:hypothetical protein
LDIADRFEKMLYDNAQLARVYLHAWQGWRSNPATWSWRRGCWDRCRRCWRGIRWALRSS